jgi:hypothetical protein
MNYEAASYKKKHIHELVTDSFFHPRYFFSKTLNLFLIKQQFQQIQSYDTRVLRPVAGYRRIDKRQRSIDIKQELNIFNFEV